MRLGLIHSPTPEAVAPLDARMRLGAVPVADAVDWHARCPADGDPLGNDQNPNCVEAAFLRNLQMRMANSMHSAWKPTKDQALRLLARWGGSDGTDVNTAMADYCRSGLKPDGIQIEDVPLWATVQLGDIPNLKKAIATFCGVQLSFALPRAIETANEWPAPPGPLTGIWLPGGYGYHQGMTGKYRGNTFWVRTWGIDVPMDEAFLRAYCVAINVIVSRTWLDARGISPPGLDWDALRADLDSL